MSTKFGVLFLFAIVYSSLCAQNDNNSKSESKSAESSAVEILTDKVYLYSYFNVLFKTPFTLDENVIITTLEPNEKQVLRTQELSFTKYQKPGLGERRAFILGFYAVSPGLHKLPRLQFQSTLRDTTWQSPSLEFATFQIDEAELLLPVDAQVNSIPQRVYLGQNIVLNVWADNVTSIDRNRLRQSPEFPGFLVQKSPITPEVEKFKILGQNAYRVSLATWLLNPIQLGLLNIPAIQASVMGLERQSSSRQIEVLPLPPNPLESASNTLSAANSQSLQSANASRENIAIGQFDIHLELKPSELWTKKLPSRTSEEKSDKKNDKEANKENAAAKQLDPQPYPKDELIHVLVRITGRGNIHLVEFPEIELPPNLVLLQSEERKALELDFESAELSGWKEKEYIYKAKNSGTYQLNLHTFSYFDPQSRRWVQKPEQSISIQVADLALQNYYGNLEELHFSPMAELWWNSTYWLQKHAFYICLLFFIVTSFYFLQKLPPPQTQGRAQAQSQTQGRGRGQSKFSGLTSAANIHFDQQQSDQRNTVPNKASKRLQVQRAFWNVRHIISSRNGIFCVAIFVALFLFYLFFQNREPNFMSPKIELKASETSYSVGQLANVALEQHRNGQPLEALKTAYLYYTKLPLQKTPQRLAGSIRLKLGLSPKLPAFFFWPLQLLHIWRYASMLIFVAISLYFTYNNRKNHRKDQAYNKEVLQMLRSYRNYFLCTIVFLLSLSIPLRLHLAMNTAPKLQLQAIPQLGEDATLAASTASVQRTQWNNSLERGELVRIKGQARTAQARASQASQAPASQARASQADSGAEQTDAFSYLVLGEKQDQGWIAARDLFIFP